MLEKCCHDLDLYNMITASRPKRVASFGACRSFLPDHAPTSNAENDIFHIKKSVRNSTDDQFSSDGDIIDCQTAIIDALQADVAALALDEARQTGAVVDLSETWAKFDTCRAAR